MNIFTNAHVGLRLFFLVPEGLCNMQGLSIAAYFFILSTTVLEPDLGRLTKAHSDRRELWEYKKLHGSPVEGDSITGVNRPKSGSHTLFFLYPQFPLVTVGYNQSP